MKHIFLSLTIVVLLAGCKQSSELEKNKAKLNELKAEHNRIGNEIKELETAIALEEPKKETNTKVIDVEVATVQPETFNHFIEVQGKVESENNVMVNARTAGNITRIFVKEGDQVKKGQVLAQLDVDVLQQSLAELRTGLDLANTIYEKQKSLWDQKIGSEVQFLNAKTNKESLERRVATVRSQIAMSKIVSPINGTVDEVRVKEGETAAPGFGLIRVVNLSDVKVTATLSDAYISNIKKGDRVNVILPDVNLEIDGQISFVSNVVNPVSRTFNVEVKLGKKSDLLRPYMLAVLKVNDLTQANTIVINQNLIQLTDEGKVVFVASEDKGKKVAVAKRIETGVAYAGKITVTQGLNAGDKLIVAGYQDLVDGQQIKN